MKSIKPGRGPSMMGGFFSLLMAGFGVIWIYFTRSITMLGAFGNAFSYLGFVFILAAVASAIYNFKNTTSKNRYSAFDITDGNEEPDPLNQIFGDKNRSQEVSNNNETKNEFCPYCGTKVEGKYEFCNVCGKKLP